MDASRARRMAPRLAAMIGCLAALSACTPGRAMIFAPFSLGPAQSPVAVAVPVVPPADAVLSGDRASAPEAGPKASMPGVGRTDLGRGQGAVTVSFGSLVSEQRRLLATINDVERVRITLTYNMDLNWGAPASPEPPVVATIERAAILAGARSHVFSGLTLGFYSITIEAFDAAGDTLGRAFTDVAVDSATTPTNVDMAIRLAPTVLPPATTGGSGGSGGGGPVPTPSPTPAPTGALNANVSFQEGSNVQGLVPVGEFEVPSETYGGFTTDPAGRVAITLNGTPAEPYRRDSLYLYNADGTLHHSTLLGPLVTMAGPPVFNSGGEAFVPTPAGVLRVNAAGAVVGPVVTAYVGENERLAMASDDHLWIAMPNNKLERFAPNGTKTLSLDVAPVAMAAADQGCVWIARGNQLEKIGPTGQVVRQQTFTEFNLVSATRQLRVSDEGDVWGVSGNSNVEFGLYKLPAPGRGDAWAVDFLSAYQSKPSDMDVDRNGNLWIMSGESYPNRQYETFLIRVSPTGQYMGRYGGTRTFTKIAIDRQNRLWAFDWVTKKVRGFELP